MKKLSFKVLYTLLIITCVSASADTTKYYNVAGQCASTPFVGVNIVYTTNSDGTTTVTKQTFERPTSSNELSSRIDSLNRMIEELRSTEPTIIELTKGERVINLMQTDVYNKVEDIFYYETLDEDTVYMNEDGGREYRPNTSVAYLLTFDKEAKILKIQEVSLLNPDYIVKKTKKVKVDVVIWHDVLVNVNYNGQHGKEWKEVPEFRTDIKTETYYEQKEDPKWEVKDEYTAKWVL